MSITIPAAPITALKLLETAGYPAYLVGGCLRDLLLGRVPHDWDITTAARPEAMLKLFSEAGYITLSTGIRHGTVTVLVDHAPVECTTYRVDGAYTDARHPDRVEFSDRVADDLGRRDFTVNALACRLPAGRLAEAEGGLILDRKELEILDLFGGQEDLVAGVLRCVGDPPTRLTEDALRILRGVRFCAQLALTPDPATEAALGECREGLARISVERVAAELCRLLICPGPVAPALGLMGRAGLWPYVLPELEAPGAALCAGADELAPEAGGRLALLLFRAGPEGARAACRRLRLSGDMTDRVAALVAGAGAPLPVDEPAARRYLAKFGAAAEDALALRGTLAAVNGDEAEVAGVREATERCAAIRARGDCLTLKELAVDGRDLAQFGLAGPDIGRVLAALLEAVLEDPALNQKSILLGIAREKK